MPPLRKAATKPNTAEDERRVLRRGPSSPQRPLSSTHAGSGAERRPIPPWGAGSMDRHPPHLLQKSRRGQGSSPHTQRPRRHTESEPGEPAGPPRTLKSISLATALGGVHGGDIRAKPTRTRETGQPGGGPFGVMGRRPSRRAVARSASLFHRNAQRGAGASTNPAVGAGFDGSAPPPPAQKATDTSVRRGGESTASCGPVLWS